MMTDTSMEGTLIVLGDLYFQGVHLMTGNSGNHMCLLKCLFLGKLGGCDVDCCLQEMVLCKKLYTSSSFCARL